MKRENCFVPFCAHAKSKSGRNASAVGYSTMNEVPASCTRNREIAIAPGLRSDSPFDDRHVHRCNQRRCETMTIEEGGVRKRQRAERKTERDDARRFFRSTQREQNAQQEIRSEGRRNSGQKNREQMQLDMLDGARLGNLRRAHQGVRRDRQQ